MKFLQKSLTFAGILVYADNHEWQKPGTHPNSAGRHDCQQAGRFWVVLKTVVARQGTRP